MAIRLAMERPRQPGADIVVKLQRHSEREIRLRCFDANGEPLPSGVLGTLLIGADGRVMGFRPAGGPNENVADRAIDNRLPIL